MARSTSRQHDPSGGGRVVTVSQRSSGAAEIQKQQREDKTRDTKKKTAIAGRMW